MTPPVLYDPALIPGPEAEADNIAFLVDHPWMTVVRETFPAGDRITFHVDRDTVEPEDWEVCSSYIPSSALQVGTVYDIRTLGCENEATITYWHAFPTP